MTNNLDDLPLFGRSARKRPTDPTPEPVFSDEELPEDDGAFPVPPEAVAEVHTEITRVGDDGVRPARTLAMGHAPQPYGYELNGPSANGARPFPSHFNPPAKSPSMWEPDGDDFRAAGHAETSRVAYQNLPDLADIDEKAYQYAVSRKITGIIQDDLEVQFGLGHPTATTVGYRLRQRGWLVRKLDEQGQPVTRNTRQNRPAFVYIAVPKSAAVPVVNPAKQGPWERSVRLAADALATGGSPEARCSQAYDILSKCIERMDKEAERKRNRFGAK